MNELELREYKLRMQLLEVQLESTHRRFQAEAKEVLRLKNELVQRTNDFNSMRRLKRLVDGFKDKFYADFKAAARERDLALLYIQLLEGKRG
jgi:hypothetical protein